MKRFIALVLSLVMALSLCTPAWGAEGEATTLPDGMPVAKVESYTDTANIEWGNYGQWSPTEGLEANLEAAYTFTAPHDSETLKNCDYANWYCDFYVMLDKALGANQLFLGGNYGSFGWVGFHNGDLELEANTEIPLLGSVTNNPWTYADVASYVGTFICGVGDVDDALAGATFTVMLRLTNPENEAEYYNVNTINYTFEESVTEVGNADGLIAALEKGENVVFTDNIKIDPATMSNAYGTTGINVKNGQTIDGGNNILDIKGAGGTWDSGISTTGGTIKNITVTGSFRGIFVNHTSTHSEKVVLDNVTIDGTVYTISCDQGLYQNLEATNSTFNGWTSYAATIGEVTFTNCSFGEGSGYAFCRPYAPTTFVDCEFESGYLMDPCAAVTFENCTLDGVLITDDNVGDLVYQNIANVSVANTKCTVSFDANGGSGTMGSAIVSLDSGYTLPANGFTAPSGKQFKGWATSASGTVITAKTYTVTAPTTFYAIWENIPVYYPPVVETPAEKPTQTPTETPSQTPTQTAPSTEVTVPVGGNENTVKVEATVTGTTATIDKIDTTELNTVIGNEVDTGKVTIDFSTVTVTTGAVDSNGDVVEAAPVDTVEIPAEVIAQIAEAVADPENNAESLEIVLGDGASIEFDAAALAEKVAQAGGESIAISIKPTTAVPERLSNAQIFTVGENVAYDITVTSGGVAISDMGGNITITAPYALAEGETAEGIVVYYVDDEGNREKCETTYDAATGRVSWVTNHLSVYMVAYEAPAADDGAADDGAVSDTPVVDDAQSNGSPALWIIIVAVVVVAIVAVVVVSKKRKA